MYTYPAKILNVVDGDTIDLEVDLGFRVYHQDRFRLYGPDPAGTMGLNSPEVSTPEGRVSRDFLKSVLTVGLAVEVQTVKDRQEKYGRFLAVVSLGSGLNVNQLMIDRGYAALKQY